MNKILLIDDEEDIMKLLTEMLKEKGFNTESAADGFDAMSKLRNSYFDIMILDIFMKGMSGWEVLKGVRANPKTKGMPVVIFSILETKEAYDEAKKLRAILVPKSSGAEALMKEVNNFLKKPI